MEQEVVQSLARLDGVVGGHPFVEVGTTSGKYSHSSDDIAEHFVFLIDGGAGGRSSYIGIQFLRAAGKEDVDMGDVVLGAGVVLKLFLDIAEEPVASVTHLV